MRCVRAYRDWIPGVHIFGFSVDGHLIRFLTSTLACSSPSFSVLVRGFGTLSHSFYSQLYGWSFNLLGPLAVSIHSLCYFHWAGLSVLFGHVGISSHIPFAPNDKAGLSTPWPHSRARFHSLGLFFSIGPVIAYLFINMYQLLFWPLLLYLRGGCMDPILAR